VYGHIPITRLGQPPHSIPHPNTLTTKFGVAHRGGGAMTLGALLRYNARVSAEHRADSAHGVVGRRETSAWALGVSSPDPRKRFHGLRCSAGS
jgi:hypothetical protein